MLNFIVNKNRRPSRYRLAAMASLLLISGCSSTADITPLIHAASSAVPGKYRNTSRQVVRSIDQMNKRREIQERRQERKRQRQERKRQEQEAWAAMTPEERAAYNARQLQKYTLLWKGLEWASRVNESVGSNSGGTCSNPASPEQDAACRAIPDPKF